MGVEENDGLRVRPEDSEPLSFVANRLLPGDVVLLDDEEATREAWAVWPGGLQVGGGVTGENAGKWIERGAEKVSSLLLLFVLGKGCWKTSWSDSSLSLSALTFCGGSRS